MNSRLTVLGLLLLTLAFAPRVYPSSLGVEVLDAQYTVGFNLYRDFGATNFSRTQTLSDPFNDLITTNPFTGAEAFFAEASADLFGVHAFCPTTHYTDSRITTIRASATSEILFSPVTSETTSLTVHFVADGHWYDCTKGILSLMNVTTGDEMWNYRWGGSAGNPTNTIAGVPVLDLMYFNPIATNIALSASFVAADIYRLTLHTETFAGESPRSPKITMQLMGLEAIPTVPEPGTFTLVILGALALAAARLRQQ